MTLLAAAEAFERIAIFEVVVGSLVAIFCVMSIPFAIRVVGDLEGIKKTLEGQKWQGEAISKLRAEMQEVKIEQGKQNVLDRLTPILEKLAS